MFFGIEDKYLVIRTLKPPTLENARRGESKTVLCHMMGLCIEITGGKPDLDLPFVVSLIIGFCTSAVSANLQIND